MKTIHRNWQHWVHKTKTIQRNWQHRVHKTPDEDNPQKVATLGTQDTRRRQSRETGNTVYTIHKTKTIQRNWQHRVHKTKTIQRNCLHWVHKTQDEDNPEKLTTLGTQDTRRRQSRETGNIGYTRQDEENPEKLATPGA